MGSGRDKRKKNKGHTPGQGADKTNKKTEKNTEKQLRRLEKKTQGDEDDIDALLAKFKLEDEAAEAVTVETDCAPPSARVYGSFHPLNDKEIILFGGEWYDADKDKMQVYSDIYVLNTDKLAWKRIVSPKGPLPRTSHQAVVTRAYMYVFGGEFTSPNQEKFRHYGDLWRLDLASWRWEQLPTKGGPSPRSGHRMVLFKGKLVLFGGFYDAGKETRYYNDLWEFDLEELKWRSVGPAPGQAPMPSPRGGCGLALHPETSALFLVGGYSVAAVPSPPPGAAAAKKKAKRDDDDEGGKGTIHDDVWALDLANYSWEKVKKAGFLPTPRTSFGLAAHKGRAVFFGGVHEREGAGDKVYSEQFNEAYQFNMTSRRWFPLAVRPAKAKAAAGKAAATAAETEGGALEGPAGKEVVELPPGVSPELHAALMKMMAEKNSPLVRAATRIQAAFRGHMVRSALRSYKLGGQVSELLYSPAAYGIDLSAKDMIKPRARSAPMLCVLRNTLWVLGGMVEIGHADICLDDVWSLDLNKLDGWKCVKENTAGEEAFKELSSDEDEEEEGNGWETE